LFMAAAIGGVTVKKVKLPTPLGFILGGMLCGPSGMNWIRDIRQMQTLASLGSVFMLFALGVGFPINEVLRLRKIVITSTFVGQFLIVVLVSQLLQITTFAPTLTSALIVSSGIALSSTSIVLTHINRMEQTSQAEAMKRKRKDSEISLRPHGLRRVASIGLYGNIVLGMVACNEFSSAFFLSIPEVVASSKFLLLSSSLTGQFERLNMILFILVGVFVFIILLGYSPLPCGCCCFKKSCCCTWLVVGNKCMKCIHFLGAWFVRGSWFYDVHVSLKLTASFFLHCTQSNMHEGMKSLQFLRPTVNFLS
jgi:hypothetical protein